MFGVNTNGSPIGMNTSGMAFQANAMQALSAMQAMNGMNGVNEVNELNMMQFASALVPGTPQHTLSSSLAMAALMQTLALHQHQQQQQQLQPRHQVRNAPSPFIKVMCPRPACGKVFSAILDAGAEPSSIRSRFVAEKIAGKKYGYLALECNLSFNAVRAALTKKDFSCQPLYSCSMPAEGKPRARVHVSTYVLEEPKGSKNLKKPFVAHAFQLLGVDLDTLCKLRVQRSRHNGMYDVQAEFCSAEAAKAALRSLRCGRAVVALDEGDSVTVVFCAEYSDREGTLKVERGESGTDPEWYEQGMKSLYAPNGRWAAWTPSLSTCFALPKVGETTKTPLALPTIMGDIWSPIPSTKTSPSASGLPSPHHASSAWPAPPRQSPSPSSVSDGTLPPSPAHDAMVTSEAKSGEAKFHPAPFAHLTEAKMGTGESKTKSQETPKWKRKIPPPLLCAQIREYLSSC